MQVPLQLISSLEDCSGFDKEAFERVHASGEQVTSIRLNPFKKAGIRNLQSRVPWTDEGYYLAERPSFTFDPLFHAGCYYVQEASSMFLEQALKQTTDLSKPLRILDLCAAPGGKSTHILSLISPDSLLVSNEVIRSRASVLKDNVMKWGCSNVVVSNNDPGDFRQLENYFDVIVVDAPCSGSGLFRREPGAVEEWSEDHVQLCSRRQQRILADVLPALKPGGCLIYSTCSYSKEEDEEIVKWLIRDFSFTHYSLSVRPEWRIIESEYGYRFWPDQVKGEGFFIACLCKPAGNDKPDRKIKNRYLPLSKKEMEIISRWVLAAGHSFIRLKNTLVAVPESLTGEMELLQSSLKVIYAGTVVGELMREKLMPHHSLAMSRLCSPAVPAKELMYDSAIKFLQKKEIDFGDTPMGWHLVTFHNVALGWINVLANRANNYYPKELRILKDNQQAGL